MSLRSRVYTTISAIMDNFPPKTCFDSTKIQQSETHLNINNFQELPTIKIFFLVIFSL